MINDADDLNEVSLISHFHKLYDKVWTLGPEIYLTKRLSILSDYLTNNEIKFDIVLTEMGSLAYNTITFSSYEDEARFILLINSL